MNMELVSARRELRPVSIEDIVDVFDALQTVDEDSASLQQAALPLQLELEQLDDPLLCISEAKSLSEVIDKDNRNLRERRGYAVSSVAGRLSVFQVQAAGEIYLNRFAGDGNEAALDLATKRLASYNNVLGFRPPAERSALTSSKLPGYRIVSYELDTEVPGGYWVSLTNPRVVKKDFSNPRLDPRTREALELSDPTRPEDTVVARYPIDVHRIDENTGEHFTTIGMLDTSVFNTDLKKWETFKIAGSGKEIRFGDNSDVYRIVGSGKKDDDTEILELFIPADHASIDEVAVALNYYQTVQRLRAQKGIGPVVLNATGADLPSIFTTFEDHYGNPIPISTAKTQ